MMTAKKIEKKNPEDYKIREYTDIIVQKIINRNITRAYYLMIGHGGYYKKSVDELENVRFHIAYGEFREEAKLESALIYVESTESYNPDYFIESGNGDSQVKFSTWLYWKLRDLQARLWRIFASGTKKLNDYVDVGRSNSFEAEFIFRDSLSDDAKEILAMIETGVGFNLKKSTEYDNAVCHIGIQNFWESFIRDDDEIPCTYRHFLSVWNELRKGYQEIETDNMVYVIVDSNIA